MTIATVNLDSTARHIERAPFASESGLQRFIERHCEEVLGIKVIASARAGGGRMFNIDILAADSAGRPWIIECKHRIVDNRAVKQLKRYRDALVSHWGSARQQLGTRHNRVLSVNCDPVLVLVGYQYDDGLADDVLCLSYRYHDVEFTDDELQKQAPGRVSLHVAEEIGAPERAHPKVCKKLATMERLERLTPTLAGSFWTVDSELQRLGVKPTYGGKNFVRYRTKAGLIAEAVVVPGGIRWRITLTRVVEHDSDTANLIAMLRDALGKAG